MSAHKTDDLYEIGNLLDQVSKGKILTPMDVANKVHSYVTEQPKQEPKQDEEVVQEGLDPVGKEDDDIDNDGDTDKTDKYLLKRRKAIKKSMNEDLGDARFQPGDVLSAEQLGEDSDFVVIGITEDEEGGVAYDLMELGQAGITVSDKDIQGDDAHPLF